MSSGKKAKDAAKKTAIRVVCLVLAFSMVAGIVFSVFYYMFA